MGAAARKNSLKRPAGMFSASQVCELTGIKYALLNYWAIHQLVEPTIPAAGSGTDRWYSFDDLVMLAAIVEVQTFASRDNTLRELLARAIRRDPDARSVRVQSGCCELIVDLGSLRDRVRAWVGEKGTMHA